MAVPIIPVLTALGPLLSMALERAVPDANARAQAREALEQALAEASAEAMRTAAQVNTAEASHPSVFVAGWRPFIGWCCGIGLMYHFLGSPLLAWVASVAGLPQPPMLDVETLLVLATSMLGVATIRTFEKVRGVARQR